MIGEAIGNKFKEIGGLFIFAIFTVIIGFVCFYFGIKEAIPAFIASLFFVYVMPKSASSRLKNIAGGYIIASAFGYFGVGLLKGYLANLSELVANVLLLTIVTFAAGLVTIILGMEHPPAIAVLFYWLFGEVTTKGLIGFAIAFIAILSVRVIIFVMHKKKGIPGEEDFGMDKGLGGGLDSGSSLGGLKDFKI